MNIRVAVCALAAIVGAGVSPSLAQDSKSAALAQQLTAALEAAGVEFIPQNGGGAGVRLKKRQKGKAK